MKRGRLTRVNDDRVIENISKTTHFFERMCGLLTKPRLNKNEGLLIAPCSSVHTFGMRYNIDLVFIDKQWNIIKTVNSLKPWRMSASRNADMVLELAAGSLEQLELTTGQKLEWHNDSHI